MLITLGRGLAPMGRVASSKRFYLTSSLPREITFTRASAATYTNHNGKLVSAGTNEARFDHIAAGKKIGLLIEGAVTNKNTNYNANPTATTGFSTSGDANGVLSVVSDTAALAAAGLELLCTTGNVFKADNTAGSTAFVISFPGTVANTNKHSASVYIRSPHSGTVCTLALNLSPMNVEGNASYIRHRLENQTPDSSSRRTTLSVPAGKTVYFILNQLEELIFSTSVIVTTGSSASRSADRPYIDNIHTYPWFNAAKGYMAFRYYLSHINTQDSFVGVLHDGSANNSIGLRLGNSAQDAQAYFRASAANIFTSTNDDRHTVGTMHGGGVTWNASNALILSGAMPRSSTLSALPTGLTRLDLGTRNGGTGPLQGHIQMFEIGHGYLDAAGLGAKFHHPSDIALACGGQSLMGGHFRSQADNTDGGKQEHRRVIGGALPERVVTLANGSTTNSAASKTTDNTNYWWDPATNTAGPALTNFFEKTIDAGLHATAVLWAQGEEDSHDIGVTTSRAQYKDSLLAIFTAMRARMGDIPVYIQRIGRRTGGYTNTGGIQTVREVQAELIAAYGWCHDGGEVYDLPLYDQYQLSNAGYVAAAGRNALAILQPARLGPRIVGAIRTGTSVTVTLAHDGGSDFTPASGIEGFRFTDNGTPIAINGAVRTNATTITLTLNSAPSSGIERLYYGYDDLPSINTANIVKDNSPSATSLRTTLTSL